MEALDPLLHQPLRTQIAAFLAGCDEASFSELKRNLQVSDGNLESHLKKLIAADYVSLRRSDGPGRAQTSYSLTPTGLTALQRYIQTLQKLLPLGTQPAADPLGGVVTGS
ncbi:MAG TPA: transcriptional regulator [Aquabacterium sp.]|jgi:DNA-binding MarR family transcriptional regulator|nr:transcriptional regulator [Aquabacterium sp.]